MKRYELAEVCPGVVVYKKEMRESESGEWVRHEDAVAERRGLENAIERLLPIAQAWVGHKYEEDAKHKQEIDEAEAVLKKARGQ